MDRKTDLINYVVRLSSDLSLGLEIGDSVAIDGVCQTVVAIANKNDVSFQAVAETLRCTTLDKLYRGRMVSVERSLRLGDEIGGHEVAGHVFGTGIISQILNTHNSLTLVVHCDPSWMKYILPKGYIAIDGSSLTIGETDPDKGLFTLHLIPETQRITNFANKQLNDEVNIEFEYKTKIIVDTVEQLFAKISTQIHQ